VIERREFITLLGGGAAAWPLKARAQQSRKLLTIGFLVASPRESQGVWFAEFVQRLHERGWIEGQTIAIEHRWAEGRSDRFAAIAAEFVRLKVDVIVTGANALAAAMKSTSTLPIVFVEDPLVSGAVVSLAREPNVTALSLQNPNLPRKRVEILEEIVPRLRRLAIIGDISSREPEIEEVRKVAGTLDVQIVAFKVRRAEDIVPALEAIKGRADALYVCGDASLAVNRSTVSALAMTALLPSIHAMREYVLVGGLASYGPNIPDLYRRAADLVDKILRGAKPGDLPVEQPTNFDLAINLATAHTLGLTIPPALLARAEEVIE
jgi:putative ABC transport system substrate-binding protein